MLLFKALIGSEGPPLKVTRPSKLIAEAGAVKDTKAIFSVSPSIPENRE
jgi:hypothetical protein